MFNFKKTIAVSFAAALALGFVAAAANAATTNGLANGGFELAPSSANPPGGAAFFADGWLAAPTGNPALWSSVAHTGLHSALLTVPGGFGGSTLFQNSIDHGGLPALGAANVGDTPVLTFWAKGDVSTQPQAKNTDVRERFAEAYARFKVNSDDLKTEHPGIHAFFAAGKHLSGK